MSTQNKEYKRPECNIEGCNNPRYCDGLCCRHWEMMDKYGKILERNSRDPNEFILHEDCVEIKLFGGRPNFEYITSTFIDLDDYEKVKNYKWSLAKDGYAFNNKVGKLHRFIYPNKEEIYKTNVDHIDQDKLNNRKSNLRPANKTQNGMNRGKPVNNTSGYKCICHYENHSCYTVFICGKEKRYTKSFSYKNCSREEALQLAIDWRNKELLKLDPEYCFTDC